MKPPQTRNYSGATALVFSLIGASFVQGATYSGVAYEGFDGYAVGNLAVVPPPANSTGLNGGAGWTSPWGVTLGGDNTTVVGNRFALGNTAAPASEQIVSSGLSYAGLPTTAGALQVTGQASGNSASVGRAFGQAVDSGTFYFSYLVQKTAASARTTNVALFGATTLTAQPNERVSIGQFANNIDYLNATGIKYNAGPSNPLATPSPIVGTDQANKGDFQVGLFNPLATGSVYNSGSGKGAGVFERNATTAGAVPAQSITVGDTYMVLGKIEFNISGVDDRLTIYLNPTSLTDEGALTTYLSVSGVDFGILTGFRVFAGSNQAAVINQLPSTTFPAVAAIYDEFRFGTSFNDVVSAIPEPSAAALGGLGLLGLVLRRRRG